MARILTSLHGRQAGLAASVNGRQAVISRGGFISGDHGSQRTHGGPQTVELWDDFLGDVLADQWNAVETDTDGAQAVLAGGIGGVLQITTGNDDGNGVVLPDLSGVTSFLNWQASNGGLSMEARIKISRITLAYIFVGFTDLITIEAPIIASGTGNGITTNASDAAGFMFDTGSDADTWFLTGVAGNTDATTQVLTSAPAADTWVTLRVEVSSGGAADFFINGVQVGTRMTGAVTAATDLTPCVYASNTDGTSAVTMDVDYIHVSMNR